MANILPFNQKRAHRALVMLKNHPLAEEYQGDIQAAGSELVADAIADLGHWCDLVCIDFEEALRCAKINLEAERNGEDQEEE